MYPKTRGGNCLLLPDTGKASAYCQTSAQVILDKKFSYFPRPRGLM